MVRRLAEAASRAHSTYPRLPKSYTRREKTPPEPRRESENTEHKSRWTTGTQLRKTPSQPKLRRFPGSFPEIFYTRKLPRHRLGRLYTVWAGCTQSGPTVDFVEIRPKCGDLKISTDLAQVPMGTSQVSTETSQVSMETSPVSK